MTLKVSINGKWKEVGKDITWDEYEEYCELKDKQYSDKVASKLGVDIFNFDVLDCTRGDLDTLIIRFHSSQSLDDFVEEYEVSHFHISIKVLDREIGLVKVIVG